MPLCGASLRTRIPSTHRSTAQHTTEPGQPAQLTQASLRFFGRTARFQSTIPRHQPSPTDPFAARNTPDEIRRKPMRLLRPRFHGTALLLVAACAVTAFAQTAATKL